MEGYTYRKPISFDGEKKARNNPIFKYRRLEDEEVEEICKMIVSGKSTSEISKHTGLPNDTIYNIKTGRCFSKISDKYNTKSTIVEKRLPLPTITVINICNHIKKYPWQNNTYIADIFGCNYSQVRDIRQGRSFKSITKKYLFSR